MTTEKDPAGNASGTSGEVDEKHFEVENGGAILRGSLSEVPGAGGGIVEVVFHHGHGEHSGRYAPLVEAFCRRGWRVWTYDMRGHGRSSGPRGDIPSHGALISDLAVVLREAGLTQRPFFLLGHSLGGQVVLSALRNWAVSGELAGAEGAGACCAGVVSTSPYLRLAFKPDRRRMWLARCARRLFPGWTQRSPVRQADLSRDDAHLEGLPGREGMHDRISARMFLEVESAGRCLLEGGWEAAQPLLLLHGEADCVTSPDASREFWGRIGVPDGSECRFFEGMRHELLNELGRERVLAGVWKWMEDRRHAFLC